MVATDPLDGAKWIKEGQNPQARPCTMLLGSGESGDPVASGSGRRRKAFWVQSRRVSGNPATVYIESLAESGKRVQLQALLTVARIICGDWVRDPEIIRWERVTFTDASRAQAVMLGRVRWRGQRRAYAVATVQRTMSALRRTVEIAADMGRMTYEEAARVLRVRAVRGRAIERGRALSEHEISQLFLVLAADETRRGRRDAAVLALLWGGGLRRVEVVRAMREDLDERTQTLRVRGKGLKGRVVLLASVWPWIEAWLVERGRRPGPLLVTMGRRGVAPMSTDRVYHVVRARCEAAGIGGVVSPHDLRRSLCTRLLDTTDVLVVQRIMGHERPETTARYDRRGRQAEFRALRGVRTVLDEHAEVGR